ncbi:MAG: YhcN/YlaJ family sporulation lipoprotein [Firmicutes bacterium]|nr:YhcN/YlaJ family sporulation lipoprotein [Bacillota bacterium]
MKRCMVVGCLFILLVGCSPQAKEKSQSAEPQPTVQTQQPKVDTAKAEQAKKLAAQDPRVAEAVAVAVDQKIFVGLKVENFNRLRLESIRKDNFDKLKTRFPNHEIHVSTDTKIFNQLQKQAKALPGKIQPQQVKKQLDKIHEDMKG